MRLRHASSSCGCSSVPAARTRRCTPCCIRHRGCLLGLREGTHGLLVRPQWLRVQGAGGAAAGHVALRPHRTTLQQMKNIFSIAVPPGLLTPLFPAVAKHVLRFTTCTLAMHARVEWRFQQQAPPDKGSHHTADLVPASRPPAPPPGPAAAPAPPAAAAPPQQRRRDRQRPPPPPGPGPPRLGPRPPAPPRPLHHLHARRSRSRPPQPPLPCRPAPGTWPQSPTAPAARCRDRARSLPQPRHACRPYSRRFPCRPLAPPGRQQPRGRAAHPARSGASNSAVRGEHSAVL